MGGPVIVPLRGKRESVKSARFVTSGA